MSLGENFERPRKRDAVATKAAILHAATQRFAREGYEGVGLREIAADAGVDAALISRYFGGKEELFSEVLSGAPDPSELFEGDPSNFGVRVADMLVNDPQDDDKLDCFLIMLKSASSPKASEAIRKSSQDRFYGPFTEWIGGDNAGIRARVAGSIIMGVALSRALAPDFDLSANDREMFCDRLAGLLQQAIKP